jgi:uncharacterized membrane protein YdbT with pleckstrin-like domain
MSYIEDNLKKKEKLVELYRPSLKHIILFSIIVISGSIILYINGLLDYTEIFPIFMIYMTFFMIIFLWRKSTEYGVTNIRVICKTGIISRDVVEMNLNSIESIGLRQGIIDRILQSGTIQISGRGIGDVIFKNVDDPVKIRKTIENRN